MSVKLHIFLESFEEQLTYIYYSGLFALVILFQYYNYFHNKTKYYKYL